MNYNDELIELPDATTPRLIKVIGVGGGGGNAVGQMYRDNIPEVRYLVINTDSKALQDSPVPNQLQIGPGLGVGGNPAKGRELGEENVQKIDSILDEETKMIFITAGMGGGTGTGISPIIAREARKKGMLAIGIVTIPFLFERERRIDKALDGLEVLSNEVDAVLVINNQRLCDIYSDLTILNAFKLADRTLSNAVSSITEIISMHGRVNLDFEDVRNVLTDGGVAVMSSGYGEGEGRVMAAINNALNSPLLNNNDIYSADRILLAVTTSQRNEEALRMNEIDDITRFMQRFDSNITTKWGLAFDDSLGARIKITILASGFDLYSQGKRKSEQQGQGQAQSVDEPSYPGRGERIARYYNAGARCGMPIKLYHPRPNVYLFNDDDLRNEVLLDQVENVPTRLRTGKQLEQLKQLSNQTSQHR